jgi:DNA-binding response OmpR family regulator
VDEQLLILKGQYSVAHILAVDDDIDVLGTVERVLKREKFTVTTVSSGQKALDYLRDNMPDLVILDIIMPGISGIDVCVRIRENPRLLVLPVLFLTAKGGTDDIVEGLDAGGDDYVVKPFEIEELSARVHALLRRGTRRLPPPTLTLDGLWLDSETYQAKVLDQVIHLTSTETRLLRCLMENTDQILSLSKLLQEVWDYPADVGDPDLVRAHIRNLRVKIEKDPNRRYIHTVHGVGYMMTTS